MKTGVRLFSSRAVPGALLAARRGPALLLLSMLLLPCVAEAQETGVRPVPDVFLFASPDPLTQSVFRTQVADRRSGGVVSAILRKGDGATATAAHVDYAGVATPTNLALPTPAVGRGPNAAAALDLRDALAPKSAAPCRARRIVKRSLAADQLFSIVEELRRKK